MALLSSTDGDDDLDRTTSAAICNAMGERLRRDMGTEDDALPSRLQMLLDEFQRLDDQT